MHANGGSFMEEKRRLVNFHDRQRNSTNLATCLVAVLRTANAGKSPRAIRPFSTACRSASAYAGREVNV
jgi:hypothetical protein